MEILVHSSHFSLILSDAGEPVMDLSLFTYALYIVPADARTM